MTSRLGNPGTHCLRCLTRQAIIICNGCQGGLDIHGAEVKPATYCGGQCQMAHYPIHAAMCRDARSHRSLYRGAYLAQMLLYRIRERLWSTGISRIVKDKRGDIIVHRAEEPKTHFIPLPDVVRSMEEKDLILANLTCRMVLIHMHCLVVMMFKGESETMCLPIILIHHRLVGEVTNFQELYLEPKNSRVGITLLSLNGYKDKNSTYNHAVIKLTLNNGEQFALDISGAQFGYLMPLVPWNQYLNARVDSVTQTKHLGYHRRRSKFLVKPDEEGNGGVKTCNEEVAEVINTGIEKWQKKGIRLKDMLRLQDSAFIPKRDEFLRFIEESIESKRDMIEKAGQRQAEFESKSKSKDDMWIGKPWEEACDQKIPPSWL